MAKPQTTKTEEQGEKKIWSDEDLLPAGYEAKDLVETGLLMPMYLPKEAHEQSFAPVAGIMDRAQLLDAQEGADGLWHPMNVLVRELKIATKGCRGNFEKRKIVDVAAGGEILLPITGQVTVNRELVAALSDMAALYWIQARVIGFEKVNSGNEMAQWSIKILKLKETRASKGARYALPPWYVAAVLRGDLATSVRNAEPCGILANAELLKKLTLTGRNIIDDGGEVIATLPAGMLPDVEKKSAKEVQASA